MTRTEIDNLLTDAINAVEDVTVLDEIAGDQELLDKATYFVKAIATGAKDHPQLPEPMGRAGCFQDL